MKKLIVAAAVVGLGLVGCKSEREQANTERQELSQERAEFNQEAGELREEANRESAEAQQDANKEIAENREELAAQEKDVADAERDAADEQGTGGSGMEATSATGKLKSSTGSNLTLTDAKGAELKLRTDENTVVTHNGKKVKLDDFDEGTEVRASWMMKDNDKVAREVTVLKPAMKK